MINFLEVSLDGFISIFIIKMSLELNSFILVVVISAFCSFNTSAEEAIPLITVKENAEKGEQQFVLNPDAVAEIKKLSSPVKVVAAIGDARVGKSTALNFIHYTLKNVGTSAFHTKNAEEIFKTGNTMKAVTRGVWISIIHGKRGMDNVILLDVEGTDLGNDVVTDKLSIFTALTSSTLMLFMKEAPSTHILEFLYKIVRLSEVAFGQKESKDFPRLTAVLRGALEPPDEYKTIDQYIIDALVTGKWEDGSDMKRKAIAKRFPKDRIDVFNLPFVSNPKMLRNHKKYSRSEYYESIENLSQRLLELPEKKSLGGAGMDGKALAYLAERLVQVMNNETLWEDLSADFYSLFEEHLCRKSYEKHIKPLLDLIKNTAHDIATKEEKQMKLFRQHCCLEKWIIKAKYDIKHARELRKDFENEGNIVEMLLTAGKWVVGAAGTVAVGRTIAAWFFSDVQLKENITLLNNAQYETIGLRGVEWVWNKEAEKLGLSGRSSGVVAQEVEPLYPWAVTTGHDGYKRVDYLSLRVLMLAKKVGSCKVK